MINPALVAKIIPMSFLRLPSWLFLHCAAAWPALGLERLAAQPTEMMMAMMNSRESKMRSGIERRGRRR
ncbi:hypothetical protein JYT15_00160 [Acidimicrobium ferrooxidans]|nr:hypothetical protein [Acidimicrobium ferrooxidans]